MESRTFYGKDNDTIAADELNIKVLNNYIDNIYNDCKRGVKYVAKSLGIKANSDEKITKRNINKGLAFELLITQWLRATDSPIKAQANCLLSDTDKKPCNFASSGYADAIISYGGYDVDVEVSSKKNVSDNDFKSQLKSAQNHSNNNFSLLILNTSLSSKNNFKIYKKTIDTSKNLVIVISTEELLEITHKIITTKNATSLSEIPTSDKMKNVFTELTKCIQEHKDKDKIPKDTLTKCWLKNMLPSPPEETSKTSETPETPSM